MSVNQKNLRFSQGNAKLDKKIYHLSLPAGHSCPAALLCRAFADPEDGHITDGHLMKFRCFAASQEAAFPNVRQIRWENFRLLQEAGDQKSMAALIERSLPPEAQVTRVHASGDFFKQAYFDAWLDVITQHPDQLFYAYTKALNFWVNRLDDVPENFVLTASYGGRHDALIKQHQLRHAVVVSHPDEAAWFGLEIDHDDSIAYTRGLDSFALLLHGQQAKGSKAADAIKRMKDEGIEYAYSK